MTTLPIDSILPELNQALSDNSNVILSAEPGAGKTTRVPLALLKAPWLKNSDGSYKKILMLEPRRLAARNAAHFMSKSLNQPIGQTVGYRMRQDHKVGPNTQIEVITEGILTRLLLQDPELTNIGIIIFDEHHERSINTDLGLALSLQCQQLFREDLKLLVMSATLEEEALKTLLNAPALFCPGRSYPIEHHYLGYDTKTRLSQQMTSAILLALQENSGSILAFLPGVRDIQQVQQELLQKLSQIHPQEIALGHLSIHPLYGQLSDKEQQLAIQPAQNHRKIVLATNIAESSLTIEGIRIVVDSGLEKQLNYNPRSAMNALTTQKISQASSTQRSGRAGRMEPGIAYHLWSEQHQLEAHAPAEISRIELSDFILAVSQWGAEVSELDWLTPPPSRAVLQAQQLLNSLDLIDNKGQITSHGEHASQLGMPPRFAHMLLMASSQETIMESALLAALLSDTPKALRNNDDLSHLLHQAKNQQQSYKTLHRQADTWIKKTVINRNVLKLDTACNTENLYIPELLSIAFPDRIAQQRPGQDYQYLLSSGRGAKLHPNSTLNQYKWLIVTDIEDDQQGSSLIRKAMPIDEDAILKTLACQMKKKSHIKWNAKGQLEAEERNYLGSLIINRKKINTLSPENWQDAWRNYFKDNGINSLPWTKECLQLKARLQLGFDFLNQSNASIEHLTQDFQTPWPSFSEDALLNDIDDWLLPLLSESRSEKALKNIDLKQALLNHLGWEKSAILKKLFPETIQVPSGSNYAIDYLSTPPVLAVKLQEMFGYQGNPSICNGEIKLMIHLLSPARRPLQITQDLPHFWQNSYFDVRKDMRGKYPKHNWPENPMESEATRFTKRKTETKKPN